MGITMSGIGGGGGGPGIGSAGDSVLTLLHAIETPDTFKKRLSALKDAEDDANEAIKALADEQKQILADRTQIEKDKKAVAQANADFSAEKTRILAQAETFNATDKALSDREKAVTAAETALAAKTKADSDANSKKTAELIDREAGIKKLEDQLKDQQDHAASLTRDLEAKNADLDKRISAIKAMAASVT